MDHKAGHAVMRWLQGLPATEATASGDGQLCAGIPGVEVDHDQILPVLLAGIAVECSYCPENLDLETSRFEDLNKARALLEESLLRFVIKDGQPVVESVDETLRRYFADTCHALAPHHRLIQGLRHRLETEGRVSARSIAAKCRQYARARAR